MQISVYTLGLTDYPSAEILQKQLAQDVAAKRHPPALLLLEHPHVYTFGRQGKKENLLWSDEELEKRGITLHWTDRGGDITYHGPGQLVGYPILPLADLDTLGYLRKLEAVIIQTLAYFGIQGIRVEGQTGVWVADEQDNLPPAKIASIGVRVDANRITRHGFALNVDPDMDYWKGMIACGLENQAKTSMANLISETPTVAEVTLRVIDSFSEVFNTQPKIGKLPELPNLDWLRNLD